jgi:hypothetical protein
VCERSVQVIFVPRGGELHELWLQRLIHSIIHLSILIDVNTSHKVETPVDQYVVYSGEGQLKDGGTLVMFDIS